MKREIFYLYLSADKWLEFYSGKFNAIIVYSKSGKRLSIPARNFIPYASFAGVKGTFQITFDANNKIVNLQKVF